MPERAPEEEGRAVGVASRLGGGRGRTEVSRGINPGEGQLNWRAGYLLCIGTATGYCVAAWIDALGATL